MFESLQPGISPDTSCRSKTNPLGNSEGAFPLLCITNRKLSKENFLERIEKIAAAHPAGIILREKDLNEREYQHLAQQVLTICQKHQTCCIIHNYPDVALRLSCTALHLPIPLLRKLPPEKRAEFSVLGASCHSPEDAAEAEKLGCTYITAGHIFATDCKKGLPGRGLNFLNEVSKRVSLPVYALGGITPYNAAAVLENGAAGICVMSGVMICEDVGSYFSALHMNGM